MYSADLTQLREEVSSGSRSSRSLIEECLACVVDKAGEGGRAFLKVWVAEARAASDLVDASPRDAPLAGIPISIKDLFDVAGEVTRAGSRVRADAAPARRDATVVKRLREAGAVLIGRTNMSEFAFSPVGLNPHYGTPGNPWDRRRIPGGSSSGAAVSVADRMAHGAVGSDTGGSVRVPAALCGLVGFKPTQARVPLEGAFPLAPTLDTIGVIARSVRDCALLDAVLAGDPVRSLEAVDVRALRLAVPRNVVLDGFEKGVSAPFERALSLLSRAGAKVTDIDFAPFDGIAKANHLGGFSPVEALALHQETMAKRGGEYDPRARVRFELGRKQTGADLARLHWRRAELIAEATGAMTGYDALLIPTCVVVAPRIDEVAASDDAFWRYNNLLSRNTALINFLDGCAISVPMSSPGDAPAGLMLAGPGGADRRILAVSAAVEYLLAH